MFAYAAAFNQPLGASNPAWAVGSVITMESMFEDAASFNQGLGWCVDGINVIDAFTGTPCQETSCGLVSGACPVAEEFGAGYCQLYNKSVCWGNSRIIEATWQFCERIGVGFASAARGVHYVGGSRRLNQRRPAGLAIIDPMKPMVAHGQASVLDAKRCGRRNNTKALSPGRILVSYNLLRVLLDEVLPLLLLPLFLLLVLLLLR